MSDVALTRHDLMRGRPRVETLFSGPFRFAIIVIGCFFGTFGAWAALAPLDSGSTALAIVSPDNSRKTIQHLEGGIISVIPVREGQHVKAGDLLIALDPTSPRASYSARQQQWLRLILLRARLIAQVQDRKTLAIPASVSSFWDDDLAAFASTQQSLLDSRTSALHQEQQISERKIAQLLSQVDALGAENVGIRRQIDLIDTDLADKNTLLTQQLTGKSAVLQLERDRAALESASAANDASVAQARQGIEETKLALVQAQNLYFNQVAQESTDVNNEIAQATDAMIAAKDVLARTQIKSPVDGTVLNIRNQTIGGVVRAGDPVMDIVPSGEDLIVIAQVQPRDIDSVRVGLQAKIVLVPFASRNSLPLLGVVTEVAADTAVNEQTHQAYYQARVRVSSDELTKHPGVYLTPGMPADVTIVTGGRTMAQYLLDPFMKSLHSAFVAR